MNPFYEPRGAAAEYAKLAITIYSHCSHGCVYCYAPNVLRMNRAEFCQTPRPRTGIVRAVAAHAPKYAGGPREVLLSFMSDPYQPAEDEHRATSAVLSILREHKIKATVLTKNPGLAIENDLELFRAGDVSLGTTLVFDNGADSLKWEPHAPLPTARINAMRRAFSLGVRTWVSLEPVIDPEQTLGLIDELHDCIHEWKVGKLNHHPELEGGIDWRYFLERVTAKLDGYGSSYVIKKAAAAAASASEVERHDGR